jgi:predicted secreted protein
MAKVKAKGTTIKYGATASPTTTIPALADIELTLGDREVIDATTHDSTGGKEYLDSGLRETPTLSARVKLDPADTAHEFIRASHSSGATVYITVVLPDAGSAQFAMSGVIQGYNVSAPVNGTLDCSFTFKALTVEAFTA